MERELLAKLKKDGQLEFRDYKILLERAHFLLSQKDEKSYNLGLSIICHVAESKPTDSFVKQLLYDCIVESRIFLYGEMLEKFESEYFKDSASTFDAFAKYVYTLPSGTVLTRDQKRLFDEFKQNKKLVVSAPTSFGKSRIVPELILANDYTNIAIVLPTIALLNETYTTFKQNERFNDYRIVNSLSQPLGKKNVLIFTPEKMDLFLDENPDFRIDFFVMDEIYKIQDDPERKQVFTHCLYRLSKIVPNFYLIGPYFEGFSKKFLERTGAKFVRFDTEIVQKEVHHFHGVIPGRSIRVGEASIKKYKTKRVNTRSLLEKLTEQSFVYVGRKQTAESLASEIANKREGDGISSDLIDYMKETIDKNWSLVKCLKKGVAFHHSAIPRYIQREIVDAFNDPKAGLNVIVCTPTLIEGVNTTAKNVIIFDNNKGGEAKLSPLDVRNIKGRAGRFLAHFVGRVFTLEHVDESDVGEVIDFSYFDNENLSSEESVQVEKEDLKANNLNNRELIEKSLRDLGIPFGLVKANKFIPVENQIRLVQFFKANPQFKDRVYFHNNIPDAEKLGAILETAHEYLFSDAHANNRNFTRGNLIRLVKYYVYKNPSIKELILTQNGAKIDTKIRSAFTLMATYFEFALPKYLVAFENLFNFAYPDKKIHLKYLITKLEYGFDSKHEIALKEAGIPHGMIRQIGKLFEDCQNLEDIRKKVRENPLLLATSGLTRFEQRIFQKYV